MEIKCIRFQEDTFLPMGKVESASLTGNSWEAGDLDNAREETVLPRETGPD